MSQLRLEVLPSVSNNGSAGVVTGFSCTVLTARIRILSKPLEIAARTEELLLAIPIRCE